MHELKPCIVYTSSTFRRRNETKKVRVTGLDNSVAWSIFAAGFTPTIQVDRQMVDIAILFVSSIIYLSLFKCDRPPVYIRMY